MWKKLLTLAGHFWRLAEETQHNRKQIEESAPIGREQEGAPIHVGGYDFFTS